MTHRDTSGDCPPSEQPPTLEPPYPSSPGLRLGADDALVVFGLAGLAASLAFLSNRLINPVNYQLIELAVAGSWRVWTLPIVALGLLGGLAWLRIRIQCAGSLAVDAAPLLVPVVASGCWISGLLGPNADGGISFVLFCAMVAAAGVSAARIGQRLERFETVERYGWIAPWMLALAIAAVTAWHGRQQVVFWQHFMLGYADFGLFVTELEHCLPHKPVGDLRFVDTRMGYHCIPMFYGLAPVYALVRSPLLLMLVGPLLLNLCAVPFYQLARERTGDKFVALAVALAWLALPSLSRLPYSNTYGFQSIYLAAPWLAWALCFASRGRWRASHVCLAGAMLCEETVCGVALGWGVYLALFGGRRRDGLIIAAAAIAYLLLCTTFIIPAFAASGTYTRVRLFGDVGLASAAERLVRPRAFLYMLALAAPMAVGWSKAVRLLVPAIPPLVLVLLLDDDYLNIKYWHQTTILVVLFWATTTGVIAGLGYRVRVRAAARSAGLLIAVLLFHPWLAYSPFSQAGRMAAADPRMAAEDPRMSMVRGVRNSFAADDVVVIATERMAAHFTDFKMVYSAHDIDPARFADRPTLIVADRSDGWDELVRTSRLDQYLGQAAAAGWRVVLDADPIVILATQPPGAGGGQ